MQKPAIITDVNLHTMNDALYQYLEIKMHHIILENDYEKIVVVGEYDRNSIISNTEKEGKIFNWHRPTAKIEGEKLLIQCPPSVDYVAHYASLIATYFAINNRRHDHVFYETPSKKKCEDLIANSNLKDVVMNKTVIIGFGLEQICGKQDWLGEGSFQYVNSSLGNNPVTFLGCKHSLWGDIAARTTDFLAEMDVKLVIYIGKLGSLNENIKPNGYLASGSSSCVYGENIVWKNYFANVQSNILINGRHITSPSTILETKNWLEEKQDFDYVDPEIGHFAEAAVRQGIGFSYLHIISNNLSDNYPENLSNERCATILSKRKKLLLEIKKILSDTKLP